MKNILIVTLIICLFTFCKSNKAHLKVEKHIKAYEYLSKIEPYKDSGIYVVDTLYYIPRVFAYSYLLKNKNQKEKSKILDSLWRLDQNSSYDEKYFKISKYLNNKDNAKYNLYFDEQTDDKSMLKFSIIITMLKAFIITYLCSGIVRFIHLHLIKKMR